METIEELETRLALRGVVYIDNVLHVNGVPEFIFFEPGIGKRIKRREWVGEKTNRQNQLRWMLEFILEGRRELLLTKSPKYSYRVIWGDRWWVKPGFDNYAYAHYKRRMLCTSDFSFPATYVHRDFWPHLNGIYKRAIA